MRNDRDLVHGIGARQRQCHHCVTELVVCHDPALQRIEQAIAFLQPGDHALDRGREVGHRDRLGIAPRGQQGRLIDQICQIRTGKTGRECRDLLRLHVTAELCHLFEMHSQNLLPSPLVRAVDQDLPVEPSGAQQCRVEHFGPVGRAEQHQTARGVKAVELGQ